MGTSSPPALMSDGMFVVCEIVPPERGGVTWVSGGTDDATVEQSGGVLGGPDRGADAAVTLCSFYNKFNQVLRIDIEDEAPAAFAAVRARN